MSIDNKPQVSLFDIIEAERDKKNISITELCRQVDIDRSYYYDILKNNDCSLSIALKLAIAVGLRLYIAGEIKEVLKVL